MLLEVKNLRIAFRRGGHETVPVRDVSFSVPEHGRVAVVGESGCGKSLTALSLLRLPPTDRAYISGTTTFTGKRISYVFQNPSDSLNPVMRISAQIREALPKGMSKAAAEARVVELLARTGLPDPVRAARAYPCELSGGQQQRAMIAMALAASPDLLVADEPTTALDVTTEVNVMYAGQVVESGPVLDVLANPRHPYTRGLLAAVPALAAPRDAPLADIPGTVPPPDQWPDGCAFAPRCAYADDRCRVEMPPVTAAGAVRCACFHCKV